ncbi:MAG TPA: 3-deoxy-7-phosphoheptulonate synthase [Candidatus Limnocylindrales bacterium]|nr:3-deoxy-7-phosphoheptulonate synthase [Candidatus Limnocylindrales bacterium]
MKETLEDINVIGTKPLRPPRDLKKELPLSERAAEVVARTRKELRDIIHGRDARRLAVVVGPCSIHDPEAALEYAAKLGAIRDRMRDELLIVMRTYFEKPRTTVGWKGLINDPDLDGSCDIERGLELARSLLLEINELGVPCGTEVLDPVTPQYVADVVSWAAIGARTTESQTHREIASGLSMPVGFKNGTDGGLDVALNAMISARHPHSFLGINADGVTAVMKTRGNRDRHIVLRGGGGRTNYSAADIAAAADLVASEGVARPVMVDCSHGNSSKDPARQTAVARDVLATMQGGEGRVMGLLLESNLFPGRQDWKVSGRLSYGVSITDACIGWEETAALLEELALSLGAQGETARRAATARR